MIDECTIIFVSSFLSFRAVVESLEEALYLEPFSTHFALSPDPLARGHAYRYFAFLTFLSNGIVPCPLPGQQRTPLLGLSCSTSAEIAL